MPGPHLPHYFPDMLADNAHYLWVLTTGLALYDACKGVRSLAHYHMRTLYCGRSPSSFLEGTIYPQGCCGDYCCLRKAGGVPFGRPKFPPTAPVKAETEVATNAAGFLK